MSYLLSVEIFAPFIPLYTPEIKWETYVLEGVKELLGLNGKVEFNLFDGQLCNLEISTLKNHPYRNRSYRFRNTLAFKIETPFDFQSNKNPEELDDPDIKSIELRMAADEFKRKLFCFLVLTNIAKPGVVKCSTGEMWINGQFETDFPAIISIHRESLGDVSEMKWPKYLSLNFIDVWKWFNRNEFSFERHSKSKTETALNSFTYLFAKDYPGLEFDLFWSLIGIEALYCKGKEGLLEQIASKSQVLLGPISDFKNRLKKMYDIRSRLIHGDLSIPPNHFELESEEEDEFQTNIYNAAFLSVAILTATLQKMVALDRSYIDFKYTLI